MTSDRRPELRAQLIQGCQKVPPAFQRWDYQATVAFKACIRRCLKVAGNSKASEGALTAAINELSTYWR